MACSNSLRVWGRPIRHKNPSRGSKPWIYGKKYIVFKFLTHGDERHSKNGCASLPNVARGCHNFVMEISIDTIDTTALTKARLSEMLFEQLGLNMREARDFVDAFYEEISKGLISGREVKIAGFGNFEVHNKSARPGRNPRTGKEVTIPPRRVVTLKASGQLKTQVNKA